MPDFDSPLKNIKVASPCPADWNEMAGDDRKRFCGECRLNVYNLSGMTSYDAENLLRNSEGRLCVRYYQRSDGTILTADCPVGWARVKQRMGYLAAACASIILSLLGGFFAFTFLGKQMVSRRFIPVPFSTPQPTMGAISIRPTPTPRPKKPEDRQVIGKIAQPRSSSF